MKKVITYGSFDLFHEGHYKLLKRAKALGDYLIVGVTTEQYDQSRGKLNVVDSLMERIEHVKQTGFADEVIIEDHVGQKVEDIQKYEVDVFTVGSDWLGKFDYLKEYCEVVYLERTKGISSTMLRSENFGIIKLGIIGSGRIAERFVPEAKYVSGVNIECVYNPKEESARNFAEKHQLNKYFSDLNSFWQDVNAVYIASPHNTHYSYIKTALEHGKHVLCEKPMVLKKREAEEVFELAESKKLILMEALKTAYAPGFIKLVSNAKSGSIGRICDVEAAFTKLLPHSLTREFSYEENGGSFTELGSYPLLAITKILGKNYQDIKFVSFMGKSGVDLYTKAYLKYENAIAEIKVGLGVKTEGNLVVSGTNGYILADSPWWLTKGFEICFEDREQNEKVFAKFLGQGLRYEIGAFVSQINGLKKYETTLTDKDSIFIADIMEKYIEQRKNKQIMVINIS